MQFIENTAVVYDEICGKIIYVGEDYITVALPPQTKQSARIIVYPENYSKVISEKDSQK